MHLDILVQSPYRRRRFHVRLCVPFPSPSGEGLTTRPRTQVTAATGVTPAGRGRRSAQVGVMIDVDDYARASRGIRVHRCRCRSCRMGRDAKATEWACAATTQHSRMVGRPQAARRPSPNRWPQPDRASQQRRVRLLVETSQSAVRSPHSSACTRGENAPTRMKPRARNFGAQERQPLRENRMPTAATPPPPPAPA